MHEAWDTPQLAPDAALDPAERRAGLVGVLGALCFLMLVLYATVVGRGGLDAWLVDAVHRGASLLDPFGSYWVEGAARDLAGLGGLTVLGLVVAAAVAHLVLARGWCVAVLLLLALSGGILLTVLLKLSFGRMGFSLSPGWLSMFSASFPSLNAVLSAIIYPTLAAVLAVAYGNRLVAAFVVGCAVLATLLVGLSRTLLGVHLPTDVLAGWAAGAAWAALCWIVMRRTRGWGQLR